MKQFHQAINFLIVCTSTIKPSILKRELLYVKIEKTAEKREIKTGHVFLSIS